MTQDTKDKSAEALQRLEMLLSLGWVVTSMARPWEWGDYYVELANTNTATADRIGSCGSDLATAVTRVIDAAAALDPTFRSFEIAVS